MPCSNSTTGLCKGCAEVAQVAAKGGASVDPRRRSEPAIEAEREPLRQKSVVTNLNWGAGTPERFPPENWLGFTFRLTFDAPATLPTSI